MEYRGCLRFHTLAITKGRAERACCVSIYCKSEACSPIPWDKHVKHLFVCMSSVMRGTTRVQLNTEPWYCSLTHFVYSSSFSPSGWKCLHFQASMTFFRAKFTHDSLTASTAFFTTSNSLWQRLPCALTVAQTLHLSTVRNKLTWSSLKYHEVDLLYLMGYLNMCRWFFVGFSGTWKPR